MGFAGFGNGGVGRGKFPAVAVEDRLGSPRNRRGRRPSPVFTRPEFPRNAGFARGAPIGSGVRYALPASEPNFA